MQSEAEEKQAKQRFMVINLMRFAGVVMVVVGIAVLQGVMSLPPMAGYVLIAMGLVEAFVTPQVLSRMWSTRNQQSDSRDDGRR